MNRSSSSRYTVPDSGCAQESAVSRPERFSIILLTLLLLTVSGLSAEEPDKDDNGFLWTIAPGSFNNPDRDRSEWTLTGGVKPEIWDDLFGGFGPRFTMIPDRRINARLDFVWGIESFAAYFAIGGPSDNA